MKIENINLANFENFCQKNNIKHVSQIKQDMFVLFVTELKENGFFVEFGACDGLELSNTFLLEDKFNWKGILSEPSISWHDKLFKNRKCIIDIRTVLDKSNEEIEFVEVTNVKTLSGFKNENFSKNFQELRTNSNNITYMVKTVSLFDLLKENNSPQMIDYLSIDTEGTEYNIIKDFDFNHYDIKIITIEHFFDEIERNKIYNLLKSKNYTRVLTEISGQDDWYVKNNIG